MKRDPLGFYEIYECGDGDVMFRIYDKRGEYRSSRCVASTEAERDCVAYQRVGYYPLSAA